MYAGVHGRPAHCQTTSATGIVSARWFPQDYTSRDAR